MNFIYKSTWTYGDRFKQNNTKRNELKCSWSVEWPESCITSAFFSFKKIDIPKFKMHENTSALLIFGNTPMKILVLVIKVRIIDVSVDRTSIFTSKCMQRDKLTRDKHQRQQVNRHEFVMSSICPVDMHVRHDCKLYANHYSNRHRL